jgi:hypothetical protein
MRMTVVLLSGWPSHAVFALQPAGISAARWRDLKTPAGDEDDEDERCDGCGEEPLIAVRKKTR